MTEERLQQLGVTRRNFLTKMAAVAFVAPVVVTFGLDGVAPADATPGSRFGNQTFGNQCFGNQSFGNQSLQEVELEFTALVQTILSFVGSGTIGFRLALSLSDQVIDAGLAFDRCENQLASSLLGAFSGRVQALAGSRIPTALASSWISSAQQVQQQIGP